MSPKPESAAEATPPEISALVEQARMATRAGHHADARRHYETALRHLSEERQSSIAASLFRWIGDTHRDEGDSESALDAYTVARAVAEQNNDLLNIAYVLNSLGILEWLWGHLDEAARLYRESEALADAIGETRLVAMVEQNTGVLANIRGDLLGALRHYRQSLNGYRKLGDVRRMAGVLSNIGMLQTDLGQWQEAEQTFAESAALCDEVDDLWSRVMIEVNRTELYTVMADFGRAMESCERAYELATRIEHHLGLGEVHKHYGILYRHLGRIGEAEQHLRTAREIADRHANPLLAGEVERELGHVYRLQGRNQEALRALNAAHRIFTDLQARTDIADIAILLADLETLFLEMVRKWGESIESKDRYTAGHCQRVAEYSCMLAERMGFDRQSLTWFRMGALLHDVGKTTVPAEILNKPGQLTEAEWEVMRHHPVAGVEILSSIDFPWDIRPMVRGHHERWDGSGYPDGLQGEEIDLSARILCVADVFDALTTNRSYRGAYEPREALEIMAADSGRIFDPEPLHLFRQLMLERLDADGG